MRKLGSNADFVWVKFLLLYDQSHIREFGYVRREDGKDIPEGLDAEIELPVFPFG
jgi:hypothetical protein